MKMTTMLYDVIVEDNFNNKKYYLLLIQIATPVSFRPFALTETLQFHLSDISFLSLTGLLAGLWIYS